MSKKKILIQLDTDAHASVFDGVVAVDAGVDHLFQYSNVTPEDVAGLVHGAMFTRGPANLHSTAVFVGGSDVAKGVRVAQSARQACFDPFRVSILHDSNGSNSTAAAAVLCASQHVDFAQVKTLVLAATGAVGQVICELVAKAGGAVVVASRKLDRARRCCENLQEKGIAPSLLNPIAMEDSIELMGILQSVEVVFGCGAAGAQLLTEQELSMARNLQTAIDLNAVPPAGLSGIQVTDHGVRREGRVDYGALGVGGLKMKIHKAAIRELFSSNQHFIDGEKMLEIGRGILSA